MNKCIHGTFKYGRCSECMDSKKISKEKAPWKDYNGNDIFQGDVLTHPVSKQSGIVVYHQEREHISDQWCVSYFDSAFESRLILQIGYRGQASVSKK